MLAAITNPFTFTFLMFAIALGCNREAYWTALLPLPFAYWSSGLLGVVLMIVGYGLALLASIAWSRRAG